jgi:hypothetical protein
MGLTPPVEELGFHVHAEDLPLVYEYVDECNQREQRQAIRMKQKQDIAGIPARSDFYNRFFEKSFGFS